MKETGAEMDSTSGEYLLLFRGPDWDVGLSDEQLQSLLGRMMAWMDGLQAGGKVKGGQPLARKGRLVAGKNGRMISDGPFAESKEVIGGYMVVETGSFDEALVIAQRCPSLEHGISIEVRPLMVECPCFKRAQERLGLSQASVNCQFR